MDNNNELNQRITQAKSKKAEILNKAKNSGGWPMLGLYHGARRVRAESGYWGIHEGWKICTTESDLIKALGTEIISSNIHHVDLQKKYGLVIKTELAPIDVEISKYGSLQIIRTDHWGNGAEPYLDQRSLFQKITDGWSYKDSFFILTMAPMIFTMPISERISSKANRYICCALFFPFLLLNIFLEEILPRHMTVTQIMILIIGLIYSLVALIPFYMNGFQKKGL